MFWLDRPISLLISYCYTDWNRPLQYWMFREWRFLFILGIFSLWNWTLLELLSWLTSPEKKHSLTCFKLCGIYKAARTKVLDCVVQYYYILNPGKDSIHFFCWILFGSLKDIEFCMKRKTRVFLHCGIFMTIKHIDTTSYSCFP